MLLNNFFKSLTTMLKIADPSSEAQAIAKMDIAITRFQQAKPVCLLCTDYLE